MKNGTAVSYKMVDKMIDKQNSKNMRNKNDKEKLPHAPFTRAQTTDKIKKPTEKVKLIQKAVKIDNCLE